jgi:hypothetical protein
MRLKAIDKLEAAIAFMQAEQPEAPAATVRMHPQRVTSPASQAARADIARAAVAHVAKMNGNGHAPASDLPPARQRMLDAIAFYEAIGVQAPTRSQLGFMSRYTNTSGGSFVNNLGALRSAGLVDYPEGGRVALTDAGRAIADNSRAPQTTEELQSAVLSMMPPARQRLLRVLIGAYPQPLSRESLGEHTGYGNVSGGSFVNNLGALRSSGLIDYPASGLVVARNELFLEAAR